MINKLIDWFSEFFYYCQERSRFSSKASLPGNQIRHHQTCQKLLKWRETVRLPLNDYHLQDLWKCWLLYDLLHGHTLLRNHTNRRVTTNFHDFKYIDAKAARFSNTFIFTFRGNRVTLTDGLFGNNVHLTKLKNSSSRTWRNKCSMSSFHVYSKKC